MKNLYEKLMEKLQGKVLGRHDSIVFTVEKFDNDLITIIGISQKSRDIEFLMSLEHVKNVALPREYVIIWDESELDQAVIPLHASDMIVKSVFGLINDRLVRTWQN